MPRDPWEDPKIQRWIRRVKAELIPMIEGSSVAVSIVPDGEPDVKFAVELGLMIMLDKPILLAVPPGRRIPERLVRVADEIVELDLDSPTSQERIAAAIARLQALD